MAITLNDLTENQSSTDATSYTTASVTNTTNGLLLLSFGSALAGAEPADPTVTGLSLTWVKVNTLYYASSGSRRKIWVYRAMGASASGTITMDWGATTQLHGIWALSEFNGVDTSGSDGSGAIVQSVLSPPNTTATSGSLALAAFGSSANRPFAVYGHRANEATAPDSDFTELADQSTGVPIGALETQWRDAEDVNTSASWTTSTLWGAIAIEIKCAVAASGTTMSLITAGV